MVKKDHRRNCEKVKVSGEEMQEVGKFNYMGVTISTDSSMTYDVTHSMFEGRKL